MAHLPSTLELGWPAFSISILIVRSLEKTARCAGRRPFSVSGAQLAIKNGHRREEVVYKDRASIGLLYSAASTVPWTESGAMDHDSTVSDSRLRQLAVIRHEGATRRMGVWACGRGDVAGSETGHEMAQQNSPGL
jgi:hypothetical protein